MRDARIWIVSADGETARIASTFDGTTAIVAAPPFVDPFAGGDVEGDRADRCHKAWYRGKTRKSVFGHSPRQQFAGHIAQILLEAGREHAYDGLVLIATPEIETELRRALAPETQARLIGELIRDLGYARPLETVRSEEIRH